MSDGVRPPGMRLWIRIVLFASLAMNLLIVGLVAGAIARGGPFRDGGPGSREPVTPYTRAFEEEQRRDLRRVLTREFVREREGGTRRGVTEAYREALDVLRSEPYDPEAMEEILRRQAELTDRRRRMGEAVLATYLAGLSMDERAAYADRLEEEIESFRRKRKTRDGKDKPAR